MKALELLESATVSQLRKLCFNTGIPSTGPKPAVIAQLREKFMERCVLEYSVPNNGRNFNVLSIDMGIRNFAFAKIELDKQLPFNTPPNVKEWTKFDVTAWAGIEDQSSFDPVLYSKVCSRLVDEVLLPQGEPLPDAILIERQRFRTMGSSSVQEWVIRVNMLECMLHALIYTRVQAQKSRVDVVSTSPQRMGQYWKLEETGTRTKTADSKRMRLDIMEKWLSDMMYPKVGAKQMLRLEPQRFQLSKDEAAATTSRYKWLKQVLGRESTFVTTAGDPGKAKVDDLVDSLLHGISWLEWQQNRMLLKLEMLSGLDVALSTSDKMYESHMNQLGFLEPPPAPSDKEATRPAREKKPRKTVLETRYEDGPDDERIKPRRTRKLKPKDSFVPLGKEGDLESVLGGMKKSRGTRGNVSA